MCKSAVRSDVTGLYITARARSLFCLALPQAVNLSHLLQSPPCILGSSVCTFISTTTGTAAPVTMMRLLLCLTLLMSVLTITVLTAEDNDNEEADRATTFLKWMQKRDPVLCTPGCTCPHGCNWMCCNIN
ncbi:hypothetical protein ACOMHN_026935 [Nucella lapillus]